MWDRIKKFFENMNFIGCPVVGSQEYFRIIQKEFEPLPMPPAQLPWALKQIKCAFLKGTYSLPGEISVMYIGDDENMKLEIEIENKFVKYAEDCGCFCPKFQDPAKRGAPDRLIHLPGGFAFYIEFKSPTGELSEHQIDYHKDLRNLCIDVFVADNFERAKEILDGFLKTEEKMQSHLDGLLTCLRKY